MSRPRPDDDLVIDQRRLAAQRSGGSFDFQQQLPRLLFGIIAPFAAVIPIVMIFIMVKHNSLLSDSSGLLLVRTWLVALTLLLIWTIAYLKAEPLLARIAIGLITLIFAYAAIRLNHLVVPRPGPAPHPDALVTPTPLPKSTPLAQPDNLGPRPTIAPAPAAPAAGNNNLAAAIIGFWKVPDGNGVIQFTKMGTSMEIDEKGHGHVFNFAVLDRNRIAFTFPGPHGDRQNFVYTDVAVKNDKLSITDEEGEQVTFERGSAGLDPAQVMGTWVTPTGDDSATFASDGSFAFGDLVGRWTVLNNMVMASVHPPNGPEFHLKPMGPGPDAMAGQRVDPPTNKTTTIKLMRK